MPGLAMLPTALTLGNAVAGIAALIELTKAYAAIEHVTSCPSVTVTETKRLLR